VDAPLSSEFATTDRPHSPPAALPGPCRARTPTGPPAPPSL